MASYTPPTGDYVFLADHVLRHEFGRVPGAHLATPDVIGSVLDGLGRFVADRVVPLAAAADQQGCTLANGVVQTPRGYRDAYAAFMADGWGSLHVAAEDGGQAMPISVSLAADELVSSGAMSFALYTSMRLGVYKVLKAQAPSDVGPVLVSKLGTGEWAGSMCLTEPQCGTDLSLIRTTATRGQDGTYRLSGTKIFITGGEHDLTANIVHLVLARVAGGPSGLGGLGLFVVPKLDLDDQGGWTRPNGVRCARLEDKLGIHASATAELVFDGARGWLLGEPGHGLAGMFTMMKMARIATPFQAIGVAEIVSQNAIAYAQERVQGRDLVDGGKGPIPIIGHPNIRREVVRMRSLTASARMLAFLTAIIFDQSEADDPAAAEAEALLSILMPLSKVIATEIGVEVATAAMQTLGGHGYIRDNGIEALLRDVQILPIYEGTNDVQALDLVLRRVAGDDGRLMDAVLSWLRSQIVEALPREAARVRATIDTIADATAALAATIKTDPFAALQMAREYLWLLGHGVLGVLWLRVLSALNADGPLPVDREAKQAQARFYFAYLHADADLRARRLAAAAEVKASLLSHPLTF